MADQTTLDGTAVTERVERIEWAVRYPDGRVHPVVSRAGAEHVLARARELAVEMPRRAGGEIVRRTVVIYLPPWEVVSDG